jgi:hypothetical protein
LTPGLSGRWSQEIPGIIRRTFGHVWSNPICAKI